MKLSGVMLNSENPELLAKFYTKILGKPGWEQGQWYGYGDKGSNLLIGPHSDVKGKNTTPARLMLSFAVSDVEKEFNKVKSAGGKVIAEPYQPNKENMPKAWLATLEDPDGNYIQLATPWE